MIKRYKRFLADFELEDGSVVTAHCANPGSMKSLLDQPVKGWLSRARPGRKLPFTWEVAELGKTRVYVNPVGANRVVTSAIVSSAIPELCGYDVLRTEVAYGRGSRIDILLTGSPAPAYVEVKNVTMSLGNGRAAFPDSVTARGAKHLVELSEVARGGGRAVLFFCVSRTDAVSVEAAADIDPLYSRTLIEAMNEGVEVLAYTGSIEPTGFRLERRLPFLSNR